VPYALDGGLETWGIRGNWRTVLRYFGRSWCPNEAIIPADLIV